ncbi:TPA: L-lactate permease, partial [Staphylococcus pseudintermedius]
MSLLIAILPIIIIFTCLFIFKLSSIMTGAITFIFTAILVTLKIGGFALSFNGLLDATFHGVLISSIVSYVIFFGVFLFHLMNESQIIKKLSEEIKNLTDDSVLQIVILIVGISPLIESTSGFGTAFLVITPILISLGIENYKAVLIGILSLLAVPWGALATGTKIGSELIGINIYYLGTLTAILSFPTIIYFLAVSIYLLYGKEGIYKNKRKLVLMPIVFSITNIVSNAVIDV